jgi:hypothetical protein
VLKAYNDLAQEMEADRSNRQKPEERLREIAEENVVAAAEAIAAEGVAEKVAELKGEIAKMLSQLSERLETEVKKYDEVKKGIAIREKELREVYEIQKNASSLAALIEAQQQRQFEFDRQMAERKETLETEIQETRAAWEKEKAVYDKEQAEQEAADKKQRDRVKEEFKYSFEREQKLAREQFEHEKAKMERELALRREQLERELSERERMVVERESEYEQLKARAAAFPAELDETVKKAVGDISERLRTQAKMELELLKKEYAGERNVLSTRIEALEKALQEQSDRAAALSQQVEKAYAQVQDVAVKAIDGSSQSKSFASLQQLMVEQSRKQSVEK